MENFVCDLPLPVNFEQSEEVGKAVAGPVFEFEPHSRNGLDDVDAWERAVAGPPRRRSHGESGAPSTATGPRPPGR